MAKWAKVVSSRVKNSQGDCILNFNNPHSACQLLIRCQQIGFGERGIIPYPVGYFYPHGEPVLAYRWPLVIRFPRFENRSVYNIPTRNRFEPLGDLDSPD